MLGITAERKKNSFLSSEEVLQLRMPEQSFTDYLCPSHAWTHTAVLYQGKIILTISRFHNTSNLLVLNLFQW